MQLSAPQQLPEPRSLTYVQWNRCHEKIEDSYLPVCIVITLSFLGSSKMCIDIPALPTCHPVQVSQ